MMTMIKLKQGYFGHDDDSESDDGGKVFVEPRRKSGLKARQDDVTDTFNDFLLKMMLTATMTKSDCP